MSYIPRTPFRRVVDAALLKHQNCTLDAAPPEGIDKWAVLRDIGTARRHFNLSDRSVTVLQALIGFHPERMLGGSDRRLVVHPSNAAICERLNGMACSTMRRHLAALVDAGLILRRDSPNGKRYVKRGCQDMQAFGFDLSPLVARHEEINALAETVRREKEQLNHMRRTVSLMRRDLGGLVCYGRTAHPQAAPWDALNETAIQAARTLRRQLTLSDLHAVQSTLKEALQTATQAISTPDPSISDAQNEQHIQNSDKDTDIIESDSPNPGQSRHPDPKATPAIEVPLPMVLAVCSEIAGYVPKKIINWHQLVNAAEFVRPMMGISRTAWMDAVKIMGPREASVVVAAMLQRFGDIRSSGGYLRHLTRKYQRGEFRSGPMIAALLNQNAA